MAAKDGAEQPTADVEPVGLTDASREQMERFRTAHHTQVLTLLLSDLEGSTRQQSELGNVRAAQLVRAYRSLFRRELAAVDGEEVETAGDSFLAVFAAPSEGVKFALRLQAALRQERTAEPELPAVRVGVHQGQVVVERHEAGPKAMDIYGLQVSTAARIMDLARGGQVLCSRAVFDDARAILRDDDLAGLGTVAWCNHGPYEFKGVEDAYDVCEVGEEGRAPLTAPPASAKSWPAGRAEEELGWRPAAGVTVPGTNWVLEQRLGEDKPDPFGRRQFRGEFGEVWRAWNPADRSRQIFKFCFKRDRLPALKREARLLKQLRKYRHPNLVEVYDVTEGDRPPYYLEMEYVEGPSLAEWLAAGPPLAERLEVIAQVADALDTVHAAGIYHRDIKPSNLLLTRRADGTLQAKLTDFGLGAAEDAELLKSISTSRFGGVVGTWDYIAPELREGAPPSPQSDLYSLGVTLYQVVAGDLRRGLGDWERETKSEIVREDLHRCLATDPGERWRHAAELAQALRSHDQRLQARQLEREREAQRRRARRLATISSVAGLFALVMIVLGGYAWHARGVANEQRAEAQRQETIAQQERDEAVQARQRTEGELYYSNVLLAGNHLTSHHPDLARPLLWATREDLRRWEWGYLLGRCHLDLVTLEGHRRGVGDVRFSPDGRRIVTASDDGTAKVWDAATGRELATLRGHADAVVTAEFSPDGSRILTASADGTAKLWDAATGREVSSLEGHRPPLRVGKPGDPRLTTDAADEPVAAWDTLPEADLPNLLKSSPVAVRLGDRPVQVWERVSADELRRLGSCLREARYVACARFHRDGTRVLTASRDGTARVWDATTGACRLVLVGQARRRAPPDVLASPDAACQWFRRVGLRTAVFSPDGARIATAGQDGTAEIWEVDRGSRNPPQGSLEPLVALAGHTRAVQSIRFSPDGARVVTASADGTARVWEAATGRPACTLSVPALTEGGFGVYDAQFTPDGRGVVTASDDSRGRVWAANTGQFLLDFAGRPVAFRGDGARLLITLLGSVVLADATAGRELFTAEGHSDSVRAAAFSPDGSCVVTGSDDGTAKLWDATHRQDTVVLDRRTELLRHASFSRDGRRVVTVHFHVTPERAVVRLRVWEAATGRELALVEEQGGRIRTVQLNPDGSRLVVVPGAGPPGVWDVATGRPLFTLAGHAAPVRRVRFSPDGSLALTASEDKTARVYRMPPAVPPPSGEGRVRALSPIITLEGHADTVRVATFSPDGAHAVTASADGTARVWDVASGRRLAVLQGHTQGVSDAAFSPDGLRVVTASEDRTAKVWEAATGRLLATLEGHEEPPQEPAFSPDGSQVLTVGGLDRTVRLWDAATGRERFALRGHRWAVLSAQFHPDGSRVVTAGQDCLVKVWDVVTGRELCLVTGHGSAVFACAFSADGSRLLTASEDGTVRLITPAPWRPRDLPASDGASWQERFRLWQRQRYQAWREARKP